MEVNAALEELLIGKEKEWLSELLLLFCSIVCNLLWDEHLWQKQNELIEFPLDYFLSHISTEEIIFREEKKCLVCSDHRCMGNTPNLLSLQVEGLHLPSWLVPKAGSLLPASTPHLSWQKPKQHIHGINFVSLCWNLAEWNVRGWKGTEGAWVGLRYMGTLAMKIKPDPCWGLKSFVKFPSCFLFHVLCFVCLILWLHGSYGIGSKAIPQKKVNRACGVPHWAKPKKHWKYPLPVQVCEISSLIARPKRFGVMCGPPQYKPLQGLCLLFHSSVSDIDFLG